MNLFTVFFFFSSRRRHTRCGRDWSSDVCSSDLLGGGGDCASGTGPFGGVFPQVTVLRLVVPGPAESGCVSWRIAACGRLADGIRPGDYRISWASCGPHGVPGDRHRDGTLAVTEGEYRQAAGLCV